MSELETLHQYLDNLRTEGEIQAFGRFTLDPRKAREKIAQLQHQELSGWAGWWCRAAVALGCRSLDFSSAPTLLTAQAAFAEETPLGPVRRFLEEGDAGAEQGPVELLRNALLWVQALSEWSPSLQPTLMVEQCGKALLHLRLSGAGAELQRGSGVAERNALTLHLQDRSARSQAALQAAMDGRLRFRLGFCPIPCRLNGEPLNAPEPPGLGPFLYAGYYLCRERTSVLAVRDPLLMPARKYLLTSQLVHFFQRPRLSAPPARLNTFGLGGELPARAGWGDGGGVPVLRWRDPEPHELHLQGCQPLREDNWQLEGLPPWLVRAALFRGSGVDQVAIVQHGLLLDWEELPLSRSAREGFGWRAVVGMDSAATDVSGTRCIRGSAYERMLQWVGGEILDIHQRMCTR